MPNPHNINGKGYHTMLHSFIPLPAYVAPSKEATITVISESVICNFQGFIENIKSILQLLFRDDQRRND